MASNTSQTTKAVTGKVRLSYVNLLAARAQEDGGQPKYSALLLIPKSDRVTVGKLKAAAEAALAAGIASGKLKAGTKLAAAWGTLKDGDDRDDLDDRPEYAKHWYMNASSQSKPGLVDTDLNELMDAAEVYSGMYARVSLNAYAYNVGMNKGVTFGLNNVQKVADGEYLGGRSSAASDFGDDEWADDDDNDPLA